MGKATNEKVPYKYKYIYIYIYGRVFFVSWAKKKLGTPRVEPPKFYHFYRTFTQFFKNKIGLTRGVPFFGWVDLGCVKTYREG